MSVANFSPLCVLCLFNFSPLCIICAVNFSHCLHCLVSYTWHADCNILQHCIVLKCSLSSFHPLTLQYALCSILPPPYAVLCAIFSVQYLLCSIHHPPSPLCTIFCVLCSIFFVHYSPSPSHQINFNYYCTYLSSCLVAPRKSIFCGIIIPQNVFRISIAGEYCKSWLGINLMLSENCEIAPVMTK